MTEKKTGLELLRSPFEPHQISKLPKPTKKQTEDVKNDYKKGIRCNLCSSWHHPDVVHLDYVGHAALTDRLLEADIKWNWEPLSLDSDGLPKFDKTGGLWIKLTVAGHTRIGYGHAANSDKKEAGAREKEIIGDALRNAGMRFGAALDLWHKGDLHLDDQEEKPKSEAKEPLEEYRENVKTFIQKTSGNPVVNLPDGASTIIPQKPPENKTSNINMPINGTMLNNLVAACKKNDMPWQKVMTFTKKEYNKEPTKLNVVEYETVIKLINTGAL